MEGTVETKSCWKRTSLKKLFKAEAAMSALSGLQLDEVGVRTGIGPKYKLSLDEESNSHHSSTSYQPGYLDRYQVPITLNQDYENITHDEERKHSHSDGKI